jgi:K+ transporter
MRYSIDKFPWLLVVLLGLIMVLFTSGAILLYCYDIAFGNALLIASVLVIPVYGRELMKWNDDCDAELMIRRREKVRKKSYYKDR